MKKYIIVFAFIALMAAPCYAAEDKEFRPDIEQLSYGAVQMFVAQRQIRLEQFQQAMGQVGSYISEGVTSIDSHDELRRRIEELANASRLANALAAMNGSAIPAMRLILQRHGQSDKEIKAALPHLFGELEPTMNAVLFAKYDVLFEALKRLYAYLDLHWDKWGRKKDDFKDRELNAAYQRLIKEMGEAINLISGDNSDK